MATTAGHLSLTISIGGVDETVEIGSDVDLLIKKADDALYRAKQLGRNRTEIVMSSNTPFETPNCVSV